jgi:imidazoleglycerol-phosphate dehydratase
MTTPHPAFEARIQRTTRETSIDLSLRLHGTGRAELDMPVPFLRHMLELFAKHGRFDLTVRATGDVDVDDHHLVEDLGLALGRAIDLSGRPAFVLLGSIPAERIGTFPTELVREFFKSVANEARMALHLAILYGDNSHHMVEALFKAFAAALRMAVEVDGDEVPSTKGVLE